MLLKRYCFVGEVLWPVVIYLCPPTCLTFDPWVSLLSLFSFTVDLQDGLETFGIKSFSDLQRLNGNTHYK